MTIAIDNKKASSESIENALKVLVQSSISNVQSCNNKNAYELASKIEGLKCIVRQFQFHVYQNVIDSDNDLFEFVSADIITNWI